MAKVQGNQVTGNKALKSQAFMSALFAAAGVSPDKSSEAAAEASFAAMIEALKTRSGKAAISAKAVGFLYGYIEKSMDNGKDPAELAKTANLSSAKYVKKVQSLASLFNKHCGIPANLLPPLGRKGKKATRPSQLDNFKSMMGM